MIEEGTQWCNKKEQEADETIDVSIYKGFFEGLKTLHENSKKDVKTAKEVDECLKDIKVAISKF